MFHIHCPHCGEAREEDEFHAAGEAGIVRPKDPAGCSDAQWGDYLFFRKNPRGEHTELWVHAAGCGKFFTMLRHTVSYEILSTGTLDGSVTFDARAPANTTPPPASRAADQRR